MTEIGKPLYSEVHFDADRPYAIGGWRNLPEIIHDGQQIKGFFGDYRWLSNFGEATVGLDGVDYPSVEVAYQAAKHQPQNRAYFLNCSSKDSITYNRSHVPDLYTAAEWDEVKVDVMLFLLQQKYDPAINPDNALRLLETGDRYLEETNWWGDRFWGRDLQGGGLNTLGQLIMDVRSTYGVGR